jgi:hypothetical protein
MKFHFKNHLSKVIVLAVLLSALVCSEVPELAKLMDDTSNDFTTPICFMEEITTSVAAQVRATVTPPLVHAMQSQGPLGAPQQTIFPSNSREILLLCSTLRT